MTWEVSLSRMFMIASVVCHTAVQSARILLITAPLYSHCHSLGAIGNALDAMNHDVFAYLPDDWDEKDCLNERHIKIMKYTLKSPVRLEDPDLDSGNQLQKLQIVTNILCSSVLGNANGLKQLAAMKFDLAIVDTFPGSRCYLLIPYKLNIPYMSFGGVHSWFDTGKPFNPQMEIPLFSSPGEMTFMQRVKNALGMFGLTFVLPWYLRGEAEMTLAPELSFFEYISLIRKSVLFIQDDDVLMSGSVPVMPNTVYTGGFSPRTVEPLPQDMDTFLSSANVGAILVTFGSFGVIPENVIQAMRGVFSSLPHHVLIKSKTDFQLRNVMTRDWIPQNDVLGHNNTKLFISHCGRNGAFETMFHGVPVICMPLFADQPMVAFNIERLRIGISVDIKSLNTDRLRRVVSTVLSKPFEINAKRVSSLYRSIHPKSAGETAAHAIDLAIKYGGDHLRPEAMDLSIVSFLLLDIWILLLGFTLSLSFVSCIFFRWIVSVMMSRKTKQE